MKTIAIVVASAVAFAMPALADSVTTTTTSGSSGAIIVAPPAAAPPVAVVPPETRTYESSKTTINGDRQIDKKSETTVTPYGTSSTTTRTVHQDD